VPKYIKLGVLFPYVETKHNNTADSDIRERLNCTNIVENMDLRWRKWREAREDYIMRNFITCLFQKVLVDHSPSGDRGIRIVPP
jgi:hypothetical protein